IRSEIKPTEDEEKLLRAIRKIFPDVEFKINESYGRRFFIGESSEISSLKYVKENWRRRKVRSTAARLLREAVRPGIVSMRLSKQAAYVGVASILDFDEEPAIGSIDVEIETSDPEELIKWLTS
ncbi:MAG: RNA-binding domain-containing protein, partial [Nitrososphaerota archaeon]